MPPNIKSPINVPISDELITARQSYSQNTPPPLTLDHHDIAGDDAFFLHDIELDVSNDVEAANHEITNLEEHGDKAIDNLNRTANEQVHDHDHDRHAHRVIKHLASQIADPDELDIDQKRLYKAVSDAGEFSYGVIACEVWLLEDDRLVRPIGGWWHNHKLYQRNPELESLATTDPTPTMPGVDLPGILWSESHQDGTSATLRKTHSSGMFLRGGHRSTDGLELHLHGVPPQGLATANSHGSGTGKFGGAKASKEDLAEALHMHATTANPHALQWRDLSSIAKDPDSAKTARLGQLEKAGLHSAAAVPFHIKESHAHAQGLVIYYARCHKRTHLLSNVANDAYLRASAQMIAHAAALSETRRASVEARRRQNSVAANRFKKNLRDFRKNNEANKIDFLDFQPHRVERDQPREETLVLDDFLSEESPVQEAKRRMYTWWHKCRGGNLQVPPPLSSRQTLWTIFGAFCGLLVLSCLNEYYKMLSDDEYYLLIGPFGALMTLQYGLTAAPASQPRNAIVGQAVAGAVSLAFTYIPESILATWLRLAVGPAFAIGAMVRLGFVHPPAGAHAVLYASGQYNFKLYALVVLSSAISVIPATIVNNLSSKRQYPTYWTMIQIPQCPWAKQKENKVASTDDT